jgi:hypothetical protein
MKINQFRINKHQEMNRAKPLAIFAIIVGFIMLCLWMYFLFITKLPDFEIKPAEVSIHLAVEICTAIMLIISGIRVVFTKGEGEGMLLLSMGMLFYTLLNSSGYYAEKVSNGIIYLFIAVLMTAIYFTIMAFHGSRREKSRGRVSTDQFEQL